MRRKKIGFNQSKRRRALMCKDPENWCRRGIRIRQLADHLPTQAGVDQAFVGPDQFFLALGTSPLSATKMTALLGAFTGYNRHTTPPFRLC
jgi:hypothetical protein